MVLVQDDGDLVKENKAMREEILLSGWSRSNEEEKGLRRQMSEEKEVRKGPKREVAGMIGGYHEEVRRGRLRKGGKEKEEVCSMRCV